MARSLNFDYQPHFDHLRLLAESLVFGYHAFHHLYGAWRPFAHHPAWALMTHGYTGVALFFVLSGFLFTRIAQQGHDIDYRQFIRNRFLRIFPVFLFVFFIAISIGRDKFQPQDALYLFFSNLGQSPTSATFLTGAAWTISLEFSFYLVFPFLARFALRDGVNYLLRLILLLLVVKVAAYAVSEKPTLMFNSTLLGRFDQFLIGMTAAFVYERTRESLARWRWALMPVAGALVFVTLGWHARYCSIFLDVPKQPLWIIWPTLEAIVWAIFITVYVGGNWRYPAVVETILRRGGEVSYSLYLLHGLVIYTVHHYLNLWQAGQPWWQLAAYMLLIAAITYALSELSYRTIEKPFLSLRRKYT